MAAEKRITLDPRLSMIARLTGRCECYADIGCDHGRLGAFMLKTGQCERAILTDISEPSLKKARALIALLELEDLVEFRVGDGARALDRPVDAVVIAGMGGATAAKIIREGRERLGSARLIVQPNVGAPEVRTAMSACGYRIADERVVRDGGRNYVIIVAEPGESQYDAREILVGPVLLSRMPGELQPYARFRLRVVQKALKGARSANDAEAADALAREAAIWEEICACLQK